MVTTMVYKALLGIAEEAERYAKGVLNSSPWIVRCVSILNSSTLSPTRPSASPRRYDERWYAQP